jgi:hypothetical protein
MRGVLAIEVNLRCFLPVTGLKAQPREREMADRELK